MLNYSFPAFAETSVEDLLDRVDELYRSDSSHAAMEMQIVTENWERTTEKEVWSRGMNDTLIKILSQRKDKGIKTLKRGNQMWNYFPKIDKHMKVPPSMMMGDWLLAMMVLHSVVSCVGVTLKTAFLARPILMCYKL